MSEATIAIVGGGFAGTTLARRLERRLPERWRILLISRENSMIFSPLLAEVVGASLLPGHVAAPIRQLVRRARFLMGTVTGIDLDMRQIRCHGEGIDTVRYDQLVLACGSAVDAAAVPGMAERALFLKTVGDALDVRNRVIRRMEQAEMQANEARRRWLSTFIVIGGGFSGVEVAGQIADFLKASLRYYPRVDARQCRVVLLHNGERILPALPEKLSAFALSKMCRRGIEICLEAHVEQLDGIGVTLRSGERVDGGTVIATIGTAPAELVRSLPLPKRHGRIETAADLSVPGFPGVWAIGDCARIVNAYDDRVCPGTAQFAVREAEQLAENLLRTVKGEPTRPFCYRPKGQMASIGDQRAVAQVFGLRFAGRLAWIIWRGVHLAKIPTFSRKVRVGGEWAWSCLFPPDIAHLEFTRTGRSGSGTGHHAKPGPRQDSA